MRDDHLYDAAEVDGASIRRKIWHVTLPQLRGVLLITFILQIIGTAQAFLEPYLSTSGGPANLQPLSVRLPSLQGSTDMGVLMVALAISTIIPIVIFLVFQRTFLRGAGLGGAVKG